MSRLWLILVDPHPDEAERISIELADAGEEWLKRGIAEGYLTDANSYANADGTPRTGGYMIAVAEDWDALGALLATYPLRSTISLDVRPLNARLGVGFDVLRAAVAASPSRCSRP